MRGEGLHGKLQGVLQCRENRARKPLFLSKQPTHYGNTGEIRSKAKNTAHKARDVAFPGYPAKRVSLPDQSKCFKKEPTAWENLALKVKVKHMSHNSAEAINSWEAL